VLIIIGEFSLLIKNYVGKSLDSYYVNGLLCRTSVTAERILAKEKE
jgi:hypothetical protein